MRSLSVPVAAVVLTLGACTPALDWREVRPAGGGVTLLFPCRPDVMRRTVTLAGQTLQLSLHACAADGLTWGLAFADVADPAQLAAVLEGLRNAASANIGAAAPGDRRPMAVAGATPNPVSGRTHLAGHLPTGSNVQMDVAVFSRGMQVFQATVLGPQVTVERADTFFSSIRFSP